MILLADQSSCAAADDSPVTSGCVEKVGAAELGAQGTGPHVDPRPGAKSVCNSMIPKITSAITTTSPVRFGFDASTASRGSISESFMAAQCVGLLLCDDRGDGVVI